MILVGKWMDLESMFVQGHPESESQKSNVLSHVDLSLRCVCEWMRMSAGYRPGQEKVCVCVGVGHT